MNLFLSKSKPWSLLVVATSMAFFVSAQVIAQQGQPILFSSPNNEDIGTNVPSLTPQPPVLPGMGDATPAPSLDLAPDQDLGPPPQMPSPRNAAQMQQRLDNKENWALLTPEEILGVPTPEKILGLPEQNPDGLSGNEPAAQRFIERQQNAATNGMINFSQWGLPASESNSAVTAVAVFGSVNPTANSFFSQMLANTQPGQAQNQDADNRLFPYSSPPPAALALTPSQIADDQAFQRLISPHSAPSSAGGWASQNLSGSQPEPAFFSGSPRAESIGASFTPLTNGFHMPAGIKAFPGLIQHETTPAAPEWKPQMPPWMSSPQPGQIP